MDLYYETSREMLSLDEMLEGDLKFCLDEMEPDLKDINWSSGAGFENLTNWGGGVIGSTGGGDYWSANCWTLSGQQDHRLPTFDVTLTPENTPANKMVNPKSVIPSRIRSMQFEFEMEMMATGDDDTDDDDEESGNRTIGVDEVGGGKSSSASDNRRSPSTSDNEDEEVSVKKEPMDDDNDEIEEESLETSLDNSNEVEVKLEKDLQSVVPPRPQQNLTQQRVLPSIHKPQMFKPSVNVVQHVVKQLPVKTHVQVQRTAQGGKPRTLWLLKQPPVKQNHQASPEKDVERIIKTQTVTNPNGVQILKPNLQKLKIITSSSPSSPQQVFISRTAPTFTTVASGSPPNTPKIIANGNSTPVSMSCGSPISENSGRMFQKPPCSYSCLIVMALKNSETGCLPVSEIYSFMCENFPFFQCAPPGWKNSVRHNLSMNDCFAKIEKDPLTPGPSMSPSSMSSSSTSNNMGSGAPNSIHIASSNGANGMAHCNANGGISAGNNGGGVRKGCLWAMNPDKVTKMDDELTKWARKDPDGMRGAMKNPNDLEKLIKGELVIRTSRVKLELKSEDEDDECENDDEDEEEEVEMSLLIPDARRQHNEEEEMGEGDDDDDDDGDESGDDSDSSEEEEEEDDDEEELHLNYDSDSDEDRVPPSLKPFDLRHSIDPLNPSLDNNNAKRLIVSRPTVATSESAPKRPRLLSHQLKYVAVAKSSGLVTPSLRQPMRLL